MTNRTTQTVVHFSAAFRLPGFDVAQPAGDYRVDHDEELLEGLSTIAWHRTGAFIHLPAIDRIGVTRQMVPIDPTILQATLEEDQKRP